jgi:hypothetical protein
VPKRQLKGRTMYVYSPDSPSHHLIASQVAWFKTILEHPDASAAIRGFCLTAIAEARKEQRPADGWARCPECGSACDANGAPGALTQEIALLETKVKELEAELCAPVEYD